MADKKKQRKINYIPDNDVLLPKVNRQITDHPAVRVHHGKWKELIAWTDRSEQFSEWFPKEGKIRPVPLKKRRKKVVINIMKPLAEAIEGRLNMNYVLTGSPNSGERKDIEGSKVATKWLASNDDINDREKISEDLKYDLIRTGNCCEKIVYDMGSFGYIKSAGGGLVKQPGEVICSAVSIFNVRPDPTAKSREAMRWLVEIDEVNKDAVLERWGKNNKSKWSIPITEEKLNKIAKAKGPVGDKYRGMNEPLKEKDSYEDTYIIKYYWEKKSIKWPKGRLIIYVESELVWAGPNPALGEIPFFFDGYKRNGNSFWHLGPMHYVQDIQREFNRNVSIRSEHIEGWRAKMVVPKGAIIKKGAFTTDAFELLEVDESKGRLYPLQMPELSQQVMVQGDQLLNYKDMVSNVHEVSYSQLPKYASRAPASLYSMMLEKEGEKENPLIRRMNANLKKKARFRLRLMQKYYTSERLVKTVGEANAVSVNFFKGANLEGNTDVKIIHGISLNQSRIVQQKLLMELKQQGAPISWAKIIKILEEGTVAEELRIDIVDEMRAERENYAFQSGTYKKSFAEGGFLKIKLPDPETGETKTFDYAPYIHDNHVIHLERHTDKAKTEEAQRWDKETWNAFQQHINLHYALYLKLKSMEAQQAGAPIGRQTGQPLPTEGQGQPGPKMPGEMPGEQATMEEQAIS